MPPLELSYVEEKIELKLLNRLDSVFFFCIWTGALVTWGANLAKFSVHKRDQSFIFGLIAANISLAYVLLTEPYGPAQVDISSTLWPTHVGLVLGALFSMGSSGGRKMEEMYS
jgi:hypothetical protein